jgi:hypothetical protein
MKALLCLPLLFAACACADETADRALIEQTIAALNRLPQRSDIFTADADGIAALEQIRKGKRMVYRMSSQPGVADKPTVTISHEPWGEATINFPGMAMPPVELLSPRIVSRGVRFVTPEVALVDGTCEYREENAPAAPLFFVLRKEGADWKIAAVRPGGR